MDLETTRRERLVHLANRKPEALNAVLPVLNAHPTDAALLLMAVTAALQKRFLLLLSATPVQNSLVELYNLLTLLKPGIFQTEKAFRASYMMSGKPRLPANCDRRRDLMRDVMIRNTGEANVVRRHQGLVAEVQDPGHLVSGGGRVLTKNADAIKRTEAQVARTDSRRVDKNDVFPQRVNAQWLEAEHCFS